MFSRSDGPTALRADLVRALAFSVQQCDLETPHGGHEAAVAALAGVWNGRKGFVALVLYRIESQHVERYVFADAIDAEAALAHAVEEGLAFAESFGFGMDSPEFGALPADEQEQRLRLWNKLRKPRPGIAPDPAPAPRTPDIVPVHAGDIDPLAPPTPVPIYSPEPRSLPLPAASEPEPEPEPEPGSPVVVQPEPAGRAVLGRIELVRRGAEAPRLDPRTRLLAYL
jgi:hypothetical protein